MARLGVKPPGQEHPHDLHQGSFDVDEDALPVAVRVLVATALAALSAA
jgi:amidohydrolase